MHKIIAYFKSLTLKALVAHLLFSFAIILNALSAAFDFAYDRNAFALVQGISALLNSVLLLHYLKHQNMRFATFGLSIVYSLEFIVILYLEHFSLHSYFFPLFLPLIAYLTLSLRESTVMTLIHYGTIILLSAYAYFVLKIQSEAFTSEAIFTYIIGVFFMIFFGVFYQLMIVESYYKLMNTNHKNGKTLGEIHHRIRNNLTMISSMFSMQMMNFDHKDLQAVIDKNRTRIETIATIHDALYQNKNQNSIDFERYTDELTNHLLSLSERPIKIKMQIQKLYLPVTQTQQLGIIIHELVMNSLKYAFNPQNNTIIKLSFRHEQDKLFFDYQDNGEGCSTDIFEQSHSLGSDLIVFTVNELGGTINYEEEKEGFVVHIILPDSLLLTQKAI